ncbi:MAG: hypothetical protein SF069_15265 [Phycisphaerae bacterium]|nr:hypothetical protein [Phycisphaerae bacterium]
MIPHEHFYTLRMSQFLDPALIDERVNWEYYDYLWVGEGYIFSDILQLEDDPERTRAISIDLLDFPAAEEVLRCLGLPLHRNVNQSDVDQILGQPFARKRFVADRYSVHYMVNTPDRYEVSCTFFDAGGLVWVVVIARDAVMQANV